MVEPPSKCQTTIEADWSQSRTKLVFFIGKKEYALPVWSFYVVWKRGLRKYCNLYCFSWPTAKPHSPVWLCDTVPQWLFLFCLLEEQNLTYQGCCYCFVGTLLTLWNIFLEIDIPISMYVCTCGYVQICHKRNSRKNLQIRELGGKHPHYLSQC